MQAFRVARASQTLIERPQAHRSVEAAKRLLPPHPQSVDEFDEDALLPRLLNVNRGADGAASAGSADGADSARQMAGAVVADHADPAGGCEHEACGQESYAEGDHLTPPLSRRVG